MGSLGTLARLDEALSGLRYSNWVEGIFSYYRFRDCSVLVVWHDGQRGWIWAALPGRPGCDEADGKEGKP
ncbi:MAG: hypothetical protein KM310_10570 [Clostridiales bacterium]|nr:hypothetical protein [Clostridiales bacterium]